MRSLRLCKASPQSFAACGHDPSYLKEKGSGENIKIKCLPLPNGLDRKFLLATAGRDGDNSLLLLFLHFRHSISYCFLLVGEPIATLSLSFQHVREKGLATSSWIGNSPREWLPESAQNLSCTSRRAYSDDCGFSAHWQITAQPSLRRYKLPIKG